MIRIIHTALRSRRSNQLRIFLFHGMMAPRGPGLPHCRGFTITLRHTTLDGWSARRRDLYLTTHNTTKIQDINATGGIRIRNASKRATVDPRGRRDRLNNFLKLFRYVLLVHLTWRHLSVIYGYSVCANSAHARTRTHTRPWSSYLALW